MMQDIDGEREVMCVMGQESLGLLDKVLEI